MSPCLIIGWSVCPSVCPSLPPFLSPSLILKWLLLLLLHLSLWLPLYRPFLHLSFCSWWFPMELSLFGLLWQNFTSWMACKKGICFSRCWRLAVQGKVPTVSLFDAGLLSGFTSSVPRMPSKSGKGKATFWCLFHKDTNPEGSILMT